MRDPHPFTLTTSQWDALDRLQHAYGIGSTEGTR